MYGHLVLARSALEVSVVSKWLNDPDVAFDVRVKRGMAEQVYNAPGAHTLEAGSCRCQAAGRLLASRR
jgi:hypothetical protein